MLFIIAVVIYDCGQLKKKKKDKLWNKPVHTWAIFKILEIVFIKKAVTSSSVEHWP